MSKHAVTGTPGMHPILESIGDMAVALIRAGEEITRLRAELAQYKAGQWQPVAEDEEIRSADDGYYNIQILYKGKAFVVDYGDAIYLPDGYAICKKVESPARVTPRSGLPNDFKATIGKMLGPQDEV